ncbi:hypothetical protein IWX63_002645 [Arthrobacter sp. CAN_A2]|uniref:DUF4389 domain-containing protein n=1 Tax=Arthrobacter sp. CAN_A2 TaxID=2787718 RepID=UPI001A2FE8DF
MSSSSLTTTPPPARTPMRAGPLVMVLLGALLVSIAGGLAFGGAVISALAAFQREGQFLSTSTERFEYDSYALTTQLEDIHLDAGASEVPAGIATVQLSATGVPSTEAVFVGVARQADVDAYLSSVQHTELIDVRTDPFRAGYRDIPGSSAPAPPTEQTFWTASASGTGTQVISVDVRSGSWAVVVMNADGSQAGVVNLQAGFRSSLFAPVGLTLLLVAGLLVLVGVPLMLLGANALGKGLEPSLAATRNRQGTLPTDFHRTASGDPVRDFLPHPARLTGYLQPRLSRWLWLVKWFLVIPHLLVLGLLWVACLVNTVAAGLVILFTGRYPAGLFAFSVGVFRWTWRVQFYAAALGTDLYPPFTLARVPDYPAHFEVPYPSGLHRGLVLVKWWLLALPHLLVIAALTGAWSTTVVVVPGAGDVIRTSAPSLLSLLALIAGITLLFTARYPAPLFGLVMGIHRWTYRVAAYVFLLRDEYPPFRLDQGPEEAEAGARTMRSDEPRDLPPIDHDGKAHRP